MTLLIACATPTLALVAADRRITGDPNVAAATKLTLVHADDAKIAVSFTGAATTSSGSDTEKWILDALNVKRPSCSFEDVIERLRVAMDSAFKDRRITLLLCGQRHGLLPAPLIVTISTFQNGGQPGLCSVHRVQPMAGSAVWWCDAGTIGIDGRSQSNIIRFLEAADIEAAIEAAYRATAKASSDPRSGKKIGDDVNVAWTDATSDVWHASYRSPDGKDVAFHPNLAMLMPDGAFLARQTRTSAPIEPWVTPNSPCACGSGRVHRNCCGRGRAIGRFQTSVVTVSSPIGPIELANDAVVCGRHRLAFPPVSKRATDSRHSNRRLWILGIERDPLDYEPFEPSTIAFVGLRMPIPHGDVFVVDDCWTYVLPIHADPILARLPWLRLHRPWPPHPTLERDSRFLSVASTSRVSLWRFEMEGEVVQEARVEGNAIYWRHRHLTKRVEVEQWPADELGVMILGASTDNAYAGIKGARHLCGG